MKTLTYTESRARYAEVLDSVVNDFEEVIITRAGHEPAVIISLAEYESLILENPDLFYRCINSGGKNQSPNSTKR